MDVRPSTKDSPTTKQLVALLSAPLDAYGSGGVAAALQLPHFADVMGHLDHETNKLVALIMVQNVLKHGAVVSEPDKVCVRGGDGGLLFGRTSVAFDWHQQAGCLDRGAERAH